MSTNAISKERDVALASEQKMGLPENKRDKTTDQQILECLSSQEPLTNRVVNYSYNHRSYPLRIIHNPQKKCIVAGNLRFFFQSGLISSEPLPSKLKQHLLKLFEDKLGKQSPGFISEGGVQGKNDFKLFQSVNLSEETVPSLDIKKLIPPMPKFDIPQIPIKKPEIPTIKQLPITALPLISAVSPFDQSTDDKIKAVFNSALFTKQTFDYAYKNKQYRIFVLNNPKASLWSESFNNPVSWDFVMTSSQELPFELVSHLENLARTEARKPNRNNYKTDLVTYIRNPNRQDYESLEPITISPPNKLDTFDEEIRKCLTSKELVNRVFMYQIKDEVYKVRILYRPNGEDVSTMLKDALHGNVRFWWSHKYGILIDKRAPQELISHLEKVFNLGWWDRYWNFSVSNGEWMKVRLPDWNFTSRDSAFYLFKKKP